MPKKYRKRTHIKDFTSFPIGKDYLCPICLTVYPRQYFERHHVVACVEQGHSLKRNVLLICKTCHAIEGFGTYHATHCYRIACFNLMLSIYGPLFLLQNRGFKEYIKGYFLSHPPKESWLRYFKDHAPNIKKLGYQMYNLYGNAILQGDDAMKELFESDTTATDLSITK